MQPANQNLLQELHDIHLPTAVGVWPWAPGWYVLLAVGLILLIGSIGWGWHRWQCGKIKREALKILAQYEKEYLAMLSPGKSRDEGASSIVSDTQATSAALNELLKRVALAYFPREKVAALYGREWVKFLNDTSKKLDFLTEESVLLNCVYQPSQQQDLRPPFRLVRKWIEQREKPCSS